MILHSKRIVNLPVWGLLALDVVVPVADSKLLKFYNLKLNSLVKLFNYV
jgi:hypothetical protein